jgi:ABC-type sugar transport system substrate-binding protein
MVSTLSFRSLAVLAALGLAVMAPAQAADDVSLADLRAATRSLGFLQNATRRGEFVIGIVYAGNGAALAQQTAQRMRGLSGPNNAALKPEILSLNDLAAHAGQLDAIYLLPGATGGGAAIVEAARRRHIPVISNDRACLDANCCMLMVRDTGQVEIILDARLAGSAGVSFSSVFAMMVKRK